MRREEDADSQSECGRAAVVPDGDGAVRGADLGAANYGLRGRAAAERAVGAGAHPAFLPAVFAAPAGQADRSADHRDRDAGHYDHR
jgi:hypothetical protein